ncbi:MAG: hypothetical protein KJO49_08620 [Bacteroidia bacterium]|nr:hypothetical protein [Bacteroidia bacterium]MBT8269205.1 hypothetical protein [Bacteroidia bacterium]NNF82532.1 nuclear transport factor 2 family protein [Flavobacteriaceae bacterium]NNK69305.1 nuclear transport factor 2 family protein [Flavobacteriaceae bacterium]
MNTAEVKNSSWEVANRYVELCSQGRNIEAIDEFYHDNIVSCEMYNWPAGPTQVEGLKQVVDFQPAFFSR